MLDFDWLTNNRLKTTNYFLLFFCHKIMFYCVLCILVIMEKHISLSHALSPLKRTHIQYGDTRTETCCQCYSEGFISKIV